MIKHQPPHRRWPEIEGVLLGVGVDPDLHNCPVAIVECVGPVGMNAQRVYDPRKSMKLTDLDMAKVPDDLRGEECVAEMSALIRHLVTYLLERRIQRYLLAQVPVQVSLAVEGQQVYLGKTKDPESIINIANVAGGALGANLVTQSIRLRPKPSAWKGELDKWGNQCQTWMTFNVNCKKAGGKDPYAVPLSLPQSVTCHREFLMSDWKHLGDAVGLAKFAAVTTWPF